MTRINTFLPLLIVCLSCWIVSEARSFGPAVIKSVLSIRGGKSPKSTSRKVSSKGSSSKRKPALDADEEDDDDDHEEEDRRSSRKKGRQSSKASGKLYKGGRSSKASKSGMMNLVPWGSSGGKSKSKGFGLALGDFKDKIQDLAKQGQSAYKDVYRRAKVLRSSAFEGMLLRATWPGNEPVPQELLNEIIKHSIPAFKYGRSSADDDPYHMTLHKLWTKMCEKDWRTVVKSLFVLHSISRDCSSDACQRFAIAMKSLSRTRNPKNPEHKYFDTRPISEVDVNGEPFSKFIVAYANYVFYRMKNFSGKFEELKDITEDTHESQVVAKLKKAQQCITLGLKCTAFDKKLQNKILGHATRLIANDLKELIKLCHSKMGPLLGEGTAYGGTKADEKDILALLKYFQDASEQVKGYLSKASKAYQPLKVKIPADMEANLSGEKLESKIAELTKLSGGSVSGGKNPMRSASKVSKSLDDDEDEEEDEEEEGEADGDDEDEEGDEDDEEEDDEEEGTDSKGTDDEEDEDDDEGEDGDDEDEEGDSVENDDDDDEGDDEEGEDDEEDEEDEEGEDDEEDEDS